MKEEQNQATVLRKELCQAKAIEVKWLNHQVSGLQTTLDGLSNHTPFSPLDTPGKQERGFQFACSRMILVKMTLWNERIGKEKKKKKEVSAILNSR